MADEPNDPGASDPSSALRLFLDRLLSRSRLSAKAQDVIANLPAATSFGNPALTIPGFPNGISDWGPYPAGMTARNSFRGPGAWSFDASVSKTIPVHEQINLVFRAEGFNLLNHHNLYIQETRADVGNVGYGVPVPIIASKGGVGSDDEGLRIELKTEEKTGNCRSPT